MNKKSISLIVVLALILVGFFVLLNSNASYTGGTINEEDLDLENEILIEEDGVKTFYITGENFKFMINKIDNPDIYVKEGDLVRIEFLSKQGFHDWVVDEFGVATEKVRDTDEPTFVEFIADKKGTFEYYCSVGEHRKNGMFGKLIVE